MYVYGWYTPLCRCMYMYQGMWMCLVISLSMFLTNLSIPLAVCLHTWHVCTYQSILGSAPIFLMRSGMCVSLFSGMDVCVWQLRDPALAVLVNDRLPWLLRLGANMGSMARRWPTFSICVSATPGCPATGLALLFLPSGPMVAKP